MFLPFIKDIRLNLSYLHRGFFFKGKTFFVKKKYKINDQTKFVTVFTDQDVPRWDQLDVILTKFALDDKGNREST